MRKFLTGILIAMLTTIALANLTACNVGSYLINALENLENNSENNSLIGTWEWQDGNVLERMIFHPNGIFELAEYYNDSLKLSSIDFNINWIAQDGFVTMIFDDGYSLTHEYRIIDGRVLQFRSTHNLTFYDQKYVRVQ